MDLVSFFRTAIPVSLAIVGGGLVLTLVGIFVGNACFIMIKCFKKDKSKIEVNGEQPLSFGEPYYSKEKQLNEKFPRAS